MKIMIILKNQKTYFYSFDGRYLKRFLKMAKNTFGMEIKSIEQYETELSSNGKVRVLNTIKKHSLDN